MVTAYVSNGIAMRLFPVFSLRSGIEFIRPGGICKSTPTGPSLSRRDCSISVGPSVPETAGWCSPPRTVEGPRDFSFRSGERVHRRGSLSGRPLEPRGWQCGRSGRWRRNRDVEPGGWCRKQRGPLQAVRGGAHSQLCTGQATEPQWAAQGRKDKISIFENALVCHGCRVSPTILKWLEFISSYPGNALIYPFSRLCGCHTHLGLVWLLK